jgi:radical SAM protein with 4Fe4S-binding SPASM domain
MNDIKLKLRPGHAAENDWMAEIPLRQLFWNVTYACNFDCQVCFSNSGPEAPDELSTDEAKAMILNAHESGVKDIVISGGEPFMRNDMVEILAYMKQLGITGRIASNGSLLTRDLLRRLRDETLTQSFQISLDTLDPELFEEIHVAPAEMLDAALEALVHIREEGMHTTVSTRLTPKTLPGIPALLDRAVAEGWATVTIHCPVRTGRAEGAFPFDVDMLAELQPVFDHFMHLSEHWVVETNIPWARYHPTIRKLSRRIQVAHAGCGAARWRLAIGASGSISPCICVDRPEFQMGNVRTDDLGEVFANAPLAHLMRHPEEHGICTDCPNVRTCGGGCRAGAFAREGQVDALDRSCPARRARERAGSAV